MLMRIVTFFIFAVFSLSFIQANASALSQEQKNLYKSGIYYYDIGVSNDCNTVSSSSAANNKVYVVGDSYAQGVEGALKPKLSELGYEVSGWNAVQGRSITTPGSDPSNAPQKGIDAIEADSDTIKNSGTIVIILGTNNSDAYNADIPVFMKKINSINGSARKFWVNTGNVDQSASTIKLANTAISKYSSDFNYQVIDWYSLFNQKRSTLGNNLHPSSAGYSALADLIASTLGSSTSSGSVSTTSISGFNNTDYAGNKILSQAQLDAIQENQHFYQSAADKVGIPWQMIAVIHLREHGLQRDGPNTDGPYQIKGGNYKVGDYTDEEFQAATDDAAKFILNKAAGKDLTNIDNIKDTLFAYNGKGDRYLEQALKLGFSQDQANIGEGSAYVMNRADAKRDPTVEPTKSNNTWGQYKNGGFEYPANSDYGAFVQYSVIANISAGGSCSSGGLTSGGMTMDQAQTFMEIYKTSPDSKNYLNDGAYASCPGGGGVLANCTAFSTYFINKYTTLKGYTGAVKVGDGQELAGLVASRNPEMATGTEPKVYAIFSISAAVTGGDNGHTGVVLGIDTTKGIVITGEASCSHGLDWVGPKTHTLQEIKDEGWTFAYTDGYLKGL